MLGCTVCTFLMGAFHLAVVDVSSLCQRTSSEKNRLVSCSLLSKKLLDPLPSLVLGRIRKHRWHPAPGLTPSVILLKERS